MKKLLFLTLILISCSATKAQHIFERVTTCQYENSNWGRWVNCSDDIKIRNMASTWGKGTYKIEFYAYNKSQPSVYFLVEYLKKVDGWYIWSISDCSDVFAKAMLNGVNIIFKTSEKLSKMAQGSQGVLNIFFQKNSVTNGTAYSLKDY